MDIQRKKELIKRKKLEVPPHIVEMGLNLLYVEPHDMVARLQSSKVINIVDIDDVLDIESETVFIDISHEPYDSRLDNIGYAKQMNPHLAVVVKDIILEEYQIFLNRIYQVDAIVFPVSELNRKSLEKFIFIASSMGMLPIPMINSESERDILPSDGVKALVLGNSMNCDERFICLNIDDRGNLLRC